MKKRIYAEAPRVELTVLELEKGFLGLSNGVNYSEQKGGAGGNDSYDDEDSF